MEYQFTARDERFLRVFGILGKVRGYKTLKSIYRILENEFPGLKELPSYTGSWTQDFFGPESPRLLDDLSSYFTRRWLLCSPLLRKSNEILEPIHHVYSLSLRGADIYIGNFENILTNLQTRGISVENFIERLVVWKTMPPACTVGKAMLLSENKSNPSKSIPEYLLVTEEPMLTFDKELIEKLYEWYNNVLQCFTSPPTRVEQEFLLTIWVNPKITYERYNYLNLRLKWSEVEKSREQLIQTLSESVIPYNLREKLKYKLEDGYYEILNEIQEKRNEIQAAFEARLNKAMDLYEKLSKTSVTFGFRNDGSTGYIKLYLPEEAKTFMKTVEDYLYLWHSLQPSETIRLISEYGIEKLKMLAENQ